MEKRKKKRKKEIKEKISQMSQYKFLAIPMYTDERKNTCSHFAAAASDEEAIQVRGVTD